MKRMRPLLIAVLVLASAALLFETVFPRVNPSFATKAVVRYHYAGKTIDAEVSGADLQALKAIFVGRCSPEAITGVPSCGHSVNVSITFTDGRRSLTLCPACDKCDGVRVGDSHYYFDIGEKQRQRFEAIAAKYGMLFPCI